MIDKLKLYRGQSFDPFFNLAVEEYLLQNTDEGCCTLYLWQNQNTVVIGRNQNAFKECRTTLLEDEGGKLARRLSGGGAVFHDLGNLNFTFLVPTADYDLDKQLKVIELACEKLGVKVERSGRNDILADGRKFSIPSRHTHGGRGPRKNGPVSQPLKGQAVIKGRGFRPLKGSQSEGACAGYHDRAAFSEAC